MTITNSDREWFNETVEDFQPQIEEDMCLPTALKNVLDNLADRKDEPGLSLSPSDLNNICDYRRGMAATSRYVPDRLNPEIKGIGYEVRTATELDFEDLQAIIDDERTSLPIVELDEEYFESVDGYTPVAGPDGYEWVHVVIPFKVNEKVVLFYDPFEAIFTRSSRIDTPPVERPQSPFWDWWSRGQDVRWTMWIAQRDQTILSQKKWEQ